jgi:hypothetical protein
VGAGDDCEGHDRGQDLLHDSLLFRLRSTAWSRP